MKRDLIVCSVTCVFLIGSNSIEVRLFLVCYVAFHPTKKTSEAEPTLWHTRSKTKAGWVGWGDSRDGIGFIEML